ncbi:MAG: HIT domain-containing protein [Polyangiaceae bacterium]|nr:HIT domain-containing protein [Polyangiaceae bacterium]
MPTSLWAPWRMEYLVGHKSSECFLCTVPNDAASFREDLVVVAQEHAFVCLNRYPFTTSHLLVAPRRHVAQPSDLDEVEYVALMKLLREATVRLKRAVGCEGMNVGFNIGKAAGAGVADHLHGHVVPRWNGDNNFMPIIADVRVMPEYLDEAWQRLHHAFVDVPGERAADARPRS